MTPSKVDRILSLISQGMSYREIAKSECVNKNTVLRLGRPRPSGDDREDSRVAHQKGG